ncbi:YunG family protein [Allosphingosinicella humi]
MTAAITAFAERIRRCWSVRTASNFRADNPAYGQCSVTALVAQDFLGGDILKTRVGNAWHFYNRIDGARIDFTQSQFPSPLVYDDAPASRDDALADTTTVQYGALLKSFRDSR